MKEAALQMEWSVEGVGREGVVILVLFLILTMLLQLIANYQIVFPRSSLFFPDGNWQVIPVLHSTHEIFKEFSPPGPLGMGSDRAAWWATHHNNPTRGFKVPLIKDFLKKLFSIRYLQ